MLPGRGIRPEKKKKDNTPGKRERETNIKTETLLLLKLRQRAERHTKYSIYCTGE